FWQVHQPLRIEGLLIGRHEEMVNNNVIDEIRPHRAGIAEIIDLYRRRPAREDRSPAFPCVARQVDQYVDRIVMDQLGRLPLRRLADVDETIEGAGEAGSHGVAIVRAARIADNLEAATIMPFDQLGDQKSHRMAAEVRGEIAETD